MKRVDHPAECGPTALPPHAEAASLEEWAREANEHAAGQMADAAAELEDALAAGSQDAE